MQVKLRWIGSDPQTMRISTAPIIPLMRSDSAVMTRDASFLRPRTLGVIWNVTDALAPAAAVLEFERQRVTWTYASQSNRGTCI